MNNPIFLYNILEYNYDALLNFTQSFVDTIRNSDRYNKERLLIISGMSSNFDLTCSAKYKIPTDPANKLAISINYYIPNEFTKNREFWNSNDNWGTE